MNKDFDAIYRNLENEVEKKWKIRRIKEQANSTYHNQLLMSY